MWVGRSGAQYMCSVAWKARVVDRMPCTLVLMVMPCIVCRIKSDAENFNRLFKAQILKLDAKMEQTILVGPEALYRPVQFDALGPLLSKHAK